MRRSDNWTNIMKVRKSLEEGPEEGPPTLRRGVQTALWGNQTTNLITNSESADILQLFIHISTI